MNIPEYVSFSLNRLEKNGYSAYLVGGCVRDHIMGNVPNDYDITTNARPEQIEACFSDVKTLDIGKKHGTVTLVFDKGNVEVTTYRIDGEYKDSRHPESVTFTDRIEDDLARRDFTMNAIAYSPAGGFVDPFGGRQDIEKGIVRCVGEPCKRFDEDALRIMRALRFSSRLGFKIEDNTRNAIFEKKELLHNIALERINAELTGIFLGGYTDKVVCEFFCVFKVIVPSLNCFDSACLQRSSKLSGRVKECLFFYNLCDKSVLCDELKRLKYSNNAVKEITSVISLATDYFGKSSDSDIKRAVSKIGESSTENMYYLLYCMTGDKIYLDAVERFRVLVGDNECMTLKQLDVRGNEIIEKYGINPSLTAGILSGLLDDVIDGKIQNKKEQLLDNAKLYIQ